MQREYYYTRADKSRMRPALSQQLTLHWPPHATTAQRGSSSTCCVQRIVCTTDNTPPHAGDDDALPCRILALSADPHDHATVPTSTATAHHALTSLHDDDDSNDDYDDIDSRHSRNNNDKRRALRRVCVTLAAASYEHIRLPLDRHAAAAAVPHTCDVHVSYWRSCSARDRDGGSGGGVHNNTSSSSSSLVVAQTPCAAVLVGDVASLAQHTAMVTYDNNNNNTAAAATTTTRSASPLLLWQFASVPYKVLWLCNAPHRLLVTLPCEERVVTLDATPPPPPSSSSMTAKGAMQQADDAHSSSDGSRSSDACVHAPPSPSHACFVFARGVVPLDVAELPSHRLVAVGTYAHGVLLCALDRDNSAVLTTVLRSVSVAGVGGAVCPLTCIAALWPRAPVSASSPRRRPPAQPQRPQRRCCRVLHGAAGDDVTAQTNDKDSKDNDDDNNDDDDNNNDDDDEAEALAAYVCAGALLCSCVYDAQSALLKLSGAAGDGVVEDVHALHGASDAVLHTGTCVDVDVGVHACTVSKSLLCFTVVPPPPQERVTHNRNHSSSSDDDDDTTAAAATQQQQQTMRRGKTAVVADGVGATVVVQRLLHLQGKALLRSGDGAVVRQGRTYKNVYVARFPIVRHWQLCADSDNTVYLLDRDLTRYHVHSSVTVTRVSSSSSSMQTSDATATTTTAHSAAKHERDSDSDDTTANAGVGGRGRGAKRTRSGRCTAATPPRRRTRTSTSTRTSRVARDKATTSTRTAAAAATTTTMRNATRPAPVNVDAFVCGLAFVGADDAWLCAVVAHDMDCLSLLTWSVR